MIFVPQLCRNRLEGGTNLSKVILLPIEVQVYEFHGKSEKLKKKKASNHHKKESTKKSCVGKLRRSNYYAHSTGAFRTQSNI